MALFSAFGTSADVVSDARELMDGADFEAAEQILTAELDRAPKSSQAGMLNQLLGECRFELGDYAGARKRFDTAKAKGVADAYRYLGRLAYLDYDFPMASELYAKYRQMKNRAKKPIAPEAEEEENRISAAEGFLDRVEKIAVIDSIAVDFEDFHKAYRLPASAGRLADPEAIPAEESRQPASMAFFNEAGDFAMWAEPDTIGTQRIYVDKTYRRHLAQTDAHGRRTSRRRFRLSVHDGRRADALFRQRRPGIDRRLRHFRGLSRRRHWRISPASEYGHAV